MPYSVSRPSAAYEKITDELHKVQTKLDNEVIKVTHLEGALCAVLHVLESKKIITEVLNLASKNGKVNIQEFWEIHKSKDVKRIQKILSNYSKDELDVMFELLNTNASII